MAASIFFVAEIILSPNVLQAIPSSTCFQRFLIVALVGGLEERDFVGIVLYLPYAFYYLEKRNHINFSEDELCQDK